MGPAYLSLVNENKKIINPPRYITSVKKAIVYNFRSCKIDLSGIGNLPFDRMITSISP